jgi:excinuclease ABC subunit A
VQNFAMKTITIAAPLANQKKGEFFLLLVELFEKGYTRFVIDGQKIKFHSKDEIKALKLAKTYKHTIDLLLDQLEVSDEESDRLQESVEKAFALTGGFCKIIVGKKEHLYSSSSMCLTCATSFPELEPRLFSFNSPIGACKYCHGLGLVYDSRYAEYEHYRYGDDKAKTCRSCNGQRLNEHALAVRIGDKNIWQISQGSIKQGLQFFNELKLNKKDQEIGQTLLQEIINRFSFLDNVGLSYLSLNRTARTLSGGEGQRIRLATQIGSALSGVLYILDEPSIGLHQRDNDRLIETLKALRDQGNTVVVVEHDTDTMHQSDYLIDMGPAAGILGGQVTAFGTPDELAQNKNSLTGGYLAGKRFIAVPDVCRTPAGWLSLKHLSKNNLKDISVKIPLGVMTCISGVSGSGKSTLVMEEIVPSLQRVLQSKRRSSNEDEDFTGHDDIENLVVIDQSPIGRTPRSNPATYLGIFDEIRKLLAHLPESQVRGYKVGRFSFNVADGRCYDCRGDGTITVSMQFLADVIMTCKSCKGKRYNKETLQITYKGKTVADILELSALEAVEFFQAHKNIAKRLQLMCDVGLDYIKLGQPSTTLSGGEAQRVKLVNELAKRGRNTVYVLDEPTTGLHTSDIDKLLLVLNRLVTKGNSMIIIEHNLDVLKVADYIIDMGPEGGDEGGTIVAQGTPHKIAQSKSSHTGRYLKKVLG